MVGLLLTVREFVAPCHDYEVLPSAVKCQEMSQGRPTVQFNHCALGNECIDVISIIHVCCRRLIGDVHYAKILITANCIYLFTK